MCITYLFPSHDRAKDAAVYHQTCAFEPPEILRARGLWEKIRGT